IADGGNGAPSGGGATEATGPNAETPNVIYAVEEPCKDAILRVSTARSACVNGVVHITGDNYYYCPSKNRFEMRHYDYIPQPEIRCDGAYRPPTFPVPQGWTTTNDPNAGACVRKNPPKYVSQWVPGPKNWELQTWEVYECKDADGK